MKYLVIPIILCILLFSCEKLNLQTADTNVAVVEGYIIPGASVKVHITKQLEYQSTDTTSQPLENLEVYLKTDNNTVQLVNTGNGEYIDSNTYMINGTNYSLVFEYNNKRVTAYTIIPEKPSNFSISQTTIEAFSFGNFTPGSGTPPERPEDVTISWSNASGNYHMIVVECIEENPELININTDRPVRSFRNTPTQGDSQGINPLTFVYYGQHRIILFSLNSEYAALYERLGTSSLDISAPPTNIENGLGIFTGINSDTLLVNVVSP